MACLASLSVAWPAPADENAPQQQPADLAVTDEPKAASPDAPLQFEVRSSDGSRLRLQLLEPAIPLKTDFGTLTIPVGEIRRIDFATRVPPGVTEQVNAAINKLGDAEYKVREEASTQLTALKDAAYPALLEAAKSEDPEVVRRAEVLLEQLTKELGEENLQVQEYDVVYTNKSQIAGTIELESLAADTALLGRQALALTKLRRLSLGAEVEDGPKNVIPDPGNMTNYREQVGKTFYIQIVAPQRGVQRGAIWGTDVYTFDSSLAMAAVHAGVVAPGQTKVVPVTMLGPQPRFAASTRNGITSGDWGEYPAAYTFKTSEKGPAVFRAR